MHFKKLFPSRYLRAVDFDDGELAVVIDRMEFEMVGQGSDAEEKPVLYFSGVNTPIFCYGIPPCGPHPAPRRRFHRWRGGRNILVGFTAPLSKKREDALKFGAICCP